MINLLPYKISLRKPRLIALLICFVLLTFDIFDLQRWLFELNNYIEPLSTLILFALLSFAIAYDLKSLIYIIIFTIAVEILGVFTGFPFGGYNYNYYHSIIGIFGVPFFIGFAWYIIIYSFSNITRNPIVTALFSVLTDLVIEEYAVVKGLWFWDKSGFLIAPLQNYIAWFVIGLIGYYLIKKTNEVVYSYLSITLVLLNMSIILLIKNNLIYGLLGFTILGIYTFLYQKSSLSFLLPISKPKQAKIS